MSFRHLMRFSRSYCLQANNIELRCLFNQHQSTKLFRSEILSPVKSIRWRTNTARCFSSHQSTNEPPKDIDDDQERLPPLLMNFIPRGMPNLLYSLKNLYILNFVLYRQVDSNFNIKHFIEGAKQALVHVSLCLANNRIDELHGLVSKEALEEIKPNYDNLSVAQRREFELKKTDIVLAFAHNIRVQTLKEEFTGTHKHIVHFFVVFDCIKNLESILKEKSSKQSNAGEIFREFADSKYICNYEFKREYIDNQTPSDWVITKLLHVKEKDLFYYQRNLLLKSR